MLPWKQNNAVRFGIDFGLVMGLFGFLVGFFLFWFFFYVHICACIYVHLYPSQLKPLGKENSGFCVNVEDLGT